jgi:ElaB/YqjD/DUF883 family membrane-anchored ribosome-binding protein
MTTKHRNSHRDYDLYDDVEKIKAALFETAGDVKGKAGKIFADSIDGVRDQSEMVKERVTNYTAEKPFKSLSVALLVGIFIGYIIHK